MLADYKVCTGCGACQVACPTKCISMAEEYGGFRYPRINKNICIECGKCEKICPVINFKIDKAENTRVIGVQNKNEKIRAISTAGGFVGLVCDDIFNKSGVVYASGFKNNNEVCFGRFTSMAECLKKRVFGSKYVASELGETYNSIRNDLENGLVVCFVGLPCQVSGLKHYLDKDYSKLLLIDLTCYGAPSPKLYKEFIDYCEKKYNDSISNVNFRDKSFGYSAPSMSIRFASGKVRGQNSVIKSYLRTYFSDLSCRTSCYNCSFKTISRECDITVGDCKAIGKYNKNLDDDKGTTLVYIHSFKGEQLIDNIKANMNFTELPLNDVVKTCGVKMISSMRDNPMRYDFFADMNNMDYIELINKYCPPSLEEKMINIFKQFLLWTGLNKTGIMKKLKGR